MEYTLIYSKRKTLSLTVQPDCTVLVKAPTGYPQAEIAQFVQAHEQWIVRATARQKQRAEAENALTEKRIQELRALAEVEIPRRVEYFAKQMGVQPTDIKITSAKTRLGYDLDEITNDITGKTCACFEPAVDYVVVHELAHIKEKNHAPAFYKVVASVLLDYKAREKLLKGE